MRALARLLTVLMISAAAWPAVPPGKLRILTTVLPLKEFAAAVAGDRAEVGLLLPPGAGVHNWQPRPGDMARLADCDLLLFIGSGLEPWLPGLLRAIPPDRRPRTFEAAADLAAPEAGEGHEEGPGHGHEGLDPHVWLDFERDARMAVRIADELGRFDPPGAIEYAANAARLEARLRALDDKFRTGLAVCANRDLVLAGHGAFGYLARRYGLSQRPLYGLSPDAQPRPQDVMAAVDHCREAGIRTIFFENSVPADLARTLAREIGGRVLTLHSGHNLTREQVDGGIGFFDLMDENLAVLRAGLGCR
jgi:zinc transport system substrate-binding protein